MPVDRAFFFCSISNNIGLVWHFRVMSPFIKRDFLKNVE